VDDTIVSDADDWQMDMNENVYVDDSRMKPQPGGRLTSVAYLNELKVLQHEVPHLTGGIHKKELKTSLRNARCRVNFTTKRGEG